MVKASRISLSAACGFALVASGCRPHGVTDVSATPPTLRATGVPHCTLVPSQLRPLVVEWSGADRGSLEVRLKRGVVAVQYEGCTLKLLPDCEVPGGYAFHPFTRKQDTITLRTADDLYTQMPIGASRLEVKLARRGELQVDMTLVGEYQAARRGYTTDELAGTCTGVTHVLTAAQVGAFSFHAAAEATTEATGAHAATERALLNSDGVASACDDLSITAAAPPAQCGALIRLEFSPLLPTVARSEGSTFGPRATTSRSRRDALAATDAPAKRTPRARREGDVYDALFVPGIILSFIGLVGIPTLALGAAGIIGANRNLQKLEPTDTDAIAVEHEWRDKQRKVLYTGLGLTLGGGGLGALFILLFDRGPPRVRVTPTVGRTHAGVNLLFRF